MISQFFDGEKRKTSEETHHTADLLLQFSPRACFWCREPPSKRLFALLLFCWNPARVVQKGKWVAVPTEEDGNDADVQWKRLLRDAASAESVSGESLLSSWLDRHHCEMRNAQHSTEAKTMAHRTVLSDLMRKSSRRVREVFTKAVVCVAEAGID